MFSPLIIIPAYKSSLYEHEQGNLKITECNDLTAIFVFDNHKILEQDPSGYHGLEIYHKSERGSILTQFNPCYIKNSFLNNLIPKY
jgi:hypothetical protein